MQISGSQKKNTTRGKNKNKNVVFENTIISPILLKHYELFKYEHVFHVLRISVPIKTVCCISKDY